MSTLRLLLQPLLIALALGFVVRASSIGIYSIPSPSMNPALQVGDTILVTPYAAGEQPRHGDVIVFRSPVARDEMTVKRVIATPGDLVEARNGRVILRGDALAEPYLAAAGTTGAFGSLIVPSGSYFVLGDNRVNSLDSRQWGVVARESIAGRARVVLWSSPGGSAAVYASASAREEDATRPRRDLRIFKLVR